jgi:hypothetical protein
MAQMNAHEFAAPKAPIQAVARRRILIALVASRMRAERRIIGLSTRRSGRVVNELPS